VTPLPPGAAWTPDQPRDGETVAHCGHVRDAVLWFHAPDPIRFRRPDGTFGETCWVVCCRDCFRRAGDDIGRVEVRGDGQWQGDEPTVWRPARA
jgi:hypothetical protein